MLIDVHGHIGPLTPGAAAPIEVALYAEACSLDLVLVSNRDAASQAPQAANRDEPEANLACLAACRAVPRLAPVYWVRLGCPDSIVDAAAGALMTEPFVGLAFSPTENGFDAADGRLDQYLAVAARTGRPVLFCVGNDRHAGPRRVYELARRHPRVPVVLCICGQGEPQWAAAVDVVGEASRNETAQLYLDTAHVGLSEVLAAVRAVGAERVLYGSDALCYGDRHAGRQAKLLEELRQQLAPDEFGQVAGGNAARLFGLEGWSG